MIGSAIPNNDNLAVGLTKPVCELLQKVKGGIAIAGALFPDETGAIGEIVSAKPVQPCRKPGEALGTQCASPTGDQLYPTSMSWCRCTSSR